MMISAKTRGLASVYDVRKIQLILFLSSAFWGPPGPSPPPTADVIGSPLRHVYINLAGLHHNKDTLQRNLTVTDRHSDVSPTVLCMFAFLLPGV